MSITPKDPADFTPSMGEYKTLTPFRFWCQKVLPLVYDESLSYYEILCKVVDYLNKSMEDIDTLHGDVTNLHTAYEQLQSYVNDYFSTLDVQEEINNKLDIMASDGTLDNLLLPYFNAYKAEIDTEIVNQNERLTTLEGRVDNITQFEPGSITTDADAELVDIRVEYDGTVDSTAGNAVRNQYFKNHRDLTEYAETNGQQVISYEMGTINSSGVPTNVAHTIRTTDYIDCDTFTNIDFDYGVGLRYTVVAYDTAKTFLGRTNTLTVGRPKAFFVNQFPTMKYMKILISPYPTATTDLSIRKHLRVIFSNSILTRISNLEKTIKTPSEYIYSAQGTLVSFDERFTHTNPINIYKTVAQYTTDFDVATLKWASQKTVYMSPDGWQTADGSETQPFGNFNQCIAAEADTIILKDGVYYANENFEYATQEINRNLNIIAEHNAIIFFGGKTNDRIIPGAKMQINKGCYFENITFYGGYGLELYSGNEQCAFNNCKFLKSARNGLNSHSVNVALFNCEASDNFMDGFNYHSQNNVAPTGIIEVGCRAYRNGENTNHSCNGSTIHDGGRIIRLKCEYGECHGGVVADSNAMSYNFDVLAHNSTNRTNGEHQYNTNYHALVGAELWLYNCSGYGSKYELSASGASTIHTDTDIDSSYIYTSGGSTIDVL